MELICGGECQLDSSDLGENLVAGFYYEGSQPSGVIKYCLFLKQINGCRLRKNDPASRLIGWLL